jgi:hypothetical protein
MRSCFIILLVGLLCLSVNAAEPTPRYFSAKPGALVKAKAQITAGDKSLAKALKKLVNDADKALAEAPPTVTDKDKLPPSGDKHDYMSLAPYFWPNPDTKDGLPYLRHDGKVNPESRDPKANDSPAIKIMGDNVETLALAYYFTGNETYAQGAAKIARVWFLDPATRMTPHLKYAQAIMGVNEGRGTGILEALHISVAADALGLLAESKAWPKADKQALKEWLRTYHDWLMKSDPGKDEHNAKNNHGTFYDVQAVRIALVLGRDDSAKRILEEAKARSIAVQIDPDGKQPSNSTAPPPLATRASICMRSRNSPRSANTQASISGTSRPRTVAASAKPSTSCCPTPTYRPSPGRCRRSKTSTSPSSCSSSVKPPSPTAPKPTKPSSPNTRTHPASDSNSCL